ncbi:MAG TPA: hypothetical protein VME40_11805 [Caulobacteraceae bacterium]|nr:hypothetical protein [Caulobacteraceae bacterium]
MADALGMFADPDQLKRMPEPERVKMMRYAACMYARGQMIRKYWYDFELTDPATQKTIEKFPAAELWPKSGRMH